MMKQCPKCGWKFTTYIDDAPYCRSHGRFNWFRRVWWGFRLVILTGTKERVIKLKVNLELSDDQVRKLAKQFGVSVDEMEEGVKKFQQELSTVEGLELVLDNLDFFNY